MAELRFLADGRERALEGLGPQLKAIRLEIKKEIEDRFISQLAAAGYIKRMYLRLRMRRELNRRFSQIKSEIEAKAPPDGLF
jgi:hypothetical protein